MAEGFVHDMPFGACPMPDGGARFRLWAPDCDAVMLMTTDGGKFAMERRDDGWFQLTTDAVPPGQDYNFALPGGRRVPDPASRAQRSGPHGPSVLVDPAAYRWRHGTWAGRPWESAVVSEIHVGTATAEGTFEGLRRKLPHYVESGITAIELMPLAQFSGRRGWGYDGVLPFAPHVAYGSPDDLKRLIDEAHGHGLMMLLDVVYNHFGPDGNYLGAYASSFFNGSHQTPWGDGIDFSRTQVRDFYIHNALYWLEEYRFDGLRLDAVHQIGDDGDPDILTEIAGRVRAAFPDRHIHLVLENDRNEARRLERGHNGEPRHYTAQWNDDFHHAAHVTLTAETDGYYADYGDPVACLARALAEGLVYQGQASNFRDGRPRGEPSAALPPVAFVDFLQNHDQIGNRAFGERLTTLCDGAAVESLLVVLLLNPAVPMLFQGEEWGETNPFHYFCDFRGDLADAVREGRREEFKRFARFASPDARNAIPDPNAEATFASSRLDWDKLADGDHARRLVLVRQLLAVRHRDIVPRLAGIRGHAGEAGVEQERLLRARWTLGDGSKLTLAANLSGRRIAATLPDAGKALWPPGPRPRESLGPWATAATLETAG